MLYCHVCAIPLCTAIDGLYVVLLDITDVVTYMTLLKHLKGEDYTGKVLFIFSDDEVDKSEAIIQIRNSGYYDI